MCLAPITLKREKPLTVLQSQYREDSGFTDVVPCGKCPECLAKRSRAWGFRLYQELKRSESAVFLTLTYDDQNLPWTDHGPSLVKKDYQDFMKRIRKELSSKMKWKYAEDKDAKGNLQPRKLSYYAVGEYGSQTYRPHYHSILFNLPQEHVLNSDQIYKTWQQGNVHIGKVEMASIMYVTGYLSKTMELPEDDNRQKEFSLMSKKIGENYLTKAIKKYHNAHQEPTVSLKNGVKLAMPRYYKDKIFTERQKLIMGYEARERFKDQELKNFKTEWQKVMITQDKIRKHQKQAQLQRLKM